MYSLDDFSVERCQTHGPPLVRSKTFEFAPSAFARNAGDKSKPFGRGAPSVSRPIREMDGQSSPPPRHLPNLQQLPGRGRTEVLPPPMPTEPPLPNEQEVSGWARLSPFMQCKCPRHPCPMNVPRPDPSGWSWDWGGAGRCEAAIPARAALPASPRRPRTSRRARWPRPWRWC